MKTQAWIAVLLVLASTAGADEAKRVAGEKGKSESTNTVEDRAPKPIENKKLPDRIRGNTYFYSSFGMRDPFRSLLAGEFEPRLQELVDLHTVDLVGVVWEPDEYIAMVQDAQGYGYTLRPGDAVKNGSVVSVTEDAMVARLNIFGQSTQVTLRLQREE